MKPLGIAGPSDSGKTTLVERLVPQLRERGSVATIKHLRCRVRVDEEGKDTDRHRAAGAAATYGVMDDGSWFATGEERSLAGLLERLAPDHDYVLVEGYSDAAIPTVALAGRDHAGETVLAAERGADVDVAAVADALDDCDPVETLSSLVARARRGRDDRAGAVATFAGRVEGDAHGDCAGIERDLRAREGVHEVVLHRRAGIVGPDDVVLAVAVAGTRAAALGAVGAAADRLDAGLDGSAVTVEDEPDRRSDPGRGF